MGAAASSSEAASGLAGKVEAVPPRCPSFPQPAPAVSSQETLFAEPICSLGTAWCSQSHEDDEGAAKNRKSTVKFSIGTVGRGWEQGLPMGMQGLTRLLLLLSLWGPNAFQGRWGFSHGEEGKGVVDFHKEFLSI